MKTTIEFSEKIDQQMKRLCEIRNLGKKGRSALIRQLVDEEYKRKEKEQEK